MTDENTGYDPYNNVGKTDMRILTKSEFDALQNYREIVAFSQKTIEFCYQKALDITGEMDEGGATFDYMHNGYSTKHLLQYLNIKVEK